ncbi:MAG: phospholipase D family protein [Clostridia bacterium]|nr:phospholipase D family protein [Clostridia bacterium]
MKLVIQPYNYKLGKMLIDDLHSGKYNNFAFSVAYAKISGVDALYNSISAFRAAGGTVYATIGIDQKNTSFEALRAVLGMTEELFVFHNNNLSSTFHPKVYLLAGEKHGKVYVGSNNLTGGGLYSNYEIISYEDFDLTTPEQAEDFANMARTLGVFRQEGPCCKKATETLIKQLYDSHLVCTESEIRVTSKKSNFTKTMTQDSGKTSVFGAEPITGRARKRDFSYLAPETEIREEYQTVVINVDDSVTATSVGIEESVPAKSFYKHLSKNDVDPKSSPGQIIIPIAYKSFFEPLSEPQRTPKGAMQSERYFGLKYENNGEIVENARVIFYVPSPIHPRKNSEVRFALRNREIFGTFEQGDVLIFTQAPQSSRGQYLYTVKRIPHNSVDAASYPERFAWIVE